MSCVRVGGLEAYADDIRIPLKYGVDQCVGDTICAGGILYGQRNVPVILDFCRDINEVAERGALFLNYANPMAINTWAAIEYGKVRHGRPLPRRAARRRADRRGARRKREGELEFVCSGINHQTWYIDIRLRGKQVGRDELIAAFERHPVYSQQEKVRIDVLKRFGFYSTESNGHLSEYLPWYRKRPDETPKLDRHERLDPRRDRRLSAPLHRAQQWNSRPSSRTCVEEAETPDRSRGALDRTRQLHHRGAGDRAALSRPFQRQEQRRRSPTCRADAIIESTGFVDRFGFNMAAGITLPEACAATCIASINVQRMAVHAAIEGDLDLLKLAVLHDPLTGAICTPEEVWQMVDEMVVAQAKWLPQYAARDPRRQGAPRPRDGEDARLGRRGAQDSDRRCGWRIRGDDGGPLRARELHRAFKVVRGAKGERPRARA